MLKIHNTLTRQLEDVSLNGKNVNVYSCGITVYMRMHVGNIRAYVVWDVFHRALLYLGYDVKRVINFTDVGHMTSDEDFGEDKLEKFAKTSGKNPLEISNGYIETVIEDFKYMNILSPDGTPTDERITIDNVEKFGWTRATSYIPQMIDLIKKMEENGFTYQTDQAVYFDVTKYPGYTQMSGQNLDEKNVGNSEEKGFDPQKKHPADFVLWMKLVGPYANHVMHWNSPWGEGFPGWHIECSAMGLDKLGENIDVHTGGVDHIAVHHANERAQNFGALKKDIVRIWAHNEFLRIGDTKLSKSLGNAKTLPEIKELGMDPMDLRYLFATVNFRVPLAYSEEALKNARAARLSLIEKLRSLKTDKQGAVIPEFKEKFKKALEDNLNVSVALSILYEVLKSQNSPEDILATVFDFDRVFGLRLQETKPLETIPQEVEELAKKRLEAKSSKDYVLADQLRDQIKNLGYLVSDSADSYELTKIIK